MNLHRLLQQRAETGLSKMPVGRERLGETALFHDGKGDAIDQ